MKIFCLAALSVLLVIGPAVCGEETLGSAAPKVKSTMKILDNYISKIEDALIAEDLSKAANLANELDKVCHKLCNLDLSNSKLSRFEQSEFNRLREDFHSRVDRLSSSTHESSVDVAQLEFEKAKQACNNCHKLFKKQE
ncbi:MAG TPA: hypothetical protein ACFYD1_07145 [Candidatus Hypogeohydataceae bacterium YC38]